MLSGIAAQLERRKVSSGMLSRTTMEKIRTPACHHSSRSGGPDSWCHPRLVFFELQ